MFESAFIEFLVSKFCDIRVNCCLWLIAQRPRVYYSSLSFCILIQNRMIAMMFFQYVRLWRKGLLIDALIRTAHAHQLLPGSSGFVSGLQHDTIHNKQPVGVPLAETLLPEHLRQLGYTTHAVGKVGSPVYRQHKPVWTADFCCAFKMSAYTNV